MSKCRKELITCPKCNKEHPFTVWESINTKLDPDMKEAVKDGSAFLFVCPTCGEKTNVNYGFLYHQMEDEIMIHYVTSDEEAEGMYRLITEKKADQMLQNMFHRMLESNYLMRIVRSQNELREKVCIFDEGLDDRIIEIIKLFVLTKYCEDNPEDKAVVMYYAKKDGEDCLEIFSENQYKAQYVIPKELYDGACKAYFGKIPEIRKNDPIVDRRWAIENINPDKKNAGQKEP